MDNTGLSFEQIADFCGLHPLEVKGIADDDVAKGIKGQDPVTSGQLTREQISDAEKDPKKRLKMMTPKHKMPGVRLKRAPRYTLSLIHIYIGARRRRQRADLACQAPFCLVRGGGPPV